MGFVTRYSKITPAKKWEPLIPLDVLTDGLKYKQQMFDKNAAIIEAQLTQGAALASQIDNDQIRKQYQSDFNKLVTNINNNFSTADITKQDVMGSINEAGRSIAENTKYAQALSISRHFRDQDKLITQSKTKDGGKYYNPSAEYVINKKSQEFKNAGAKDLGDISLVEYAPYYDITDQKLKLIDKIKPEVEAELTNMGIDKSSDIYIQRVEKLTTDRVKTAMLDLYQNDAKALRQLQFDYEYNLDTNPVNVTEHYETESKKLDSDIKTLKEYQGKESNPDRKKQYDEAITALELNKKKLTARYDEYLPSKDPAKYYRFNEFLNDRIENDAKTFSYSKVVQLSEDKYGLERLKHQFDMEEIQYRAQLKALYGDGDNIDPSGDGSSLPTDGGYSAGVMMFDDMIGRPNENIPVSNVEAASLLGFEGDNAFNNDRFEMELTYGVTGSGKGIKTVGRFTPVSKRYDQRTDGKEGFYIYGYSQVEKDKKLSDSEAQNAGLVYTSSQVVKTKDLDGNETSKTIYYYKQPSRVKIDPSAQSTLTRNKAVYGSSKDGAVLMKAQNQTNAYIDGFNIANTFEKVGRISAGQNTNIRSATINTTISHLREGGIYVKLANEITDPTKKNAALLLINNLHNDLYNTYVLNGNGSILSNKALIPYKEQMKAILMTLGKL